jgi:hypothetical protein
LLGSNGCTSRTLAAEQLPAGTLYKRLTGDLMTEDPEDVGNVIGMVCANIAVIALGVSARKID